MQFAGSKPIARTNGGPEEDMKYPNKLHKHLRTAAISTLTATVWLGLPELFLENRAAPFRAETVQAEANIGVAKSRHVADLPGRNAAGALLYDQTDHVGLISSASQNFGHFDTNFNSEAADDFIVPFGKVWSIQRLMILGVYQPTFSRADSVNVIIYSDSVGLPGPVVCTYSTLVPIDTAGDFDISLSPTCVLNAGHYWVEVQANLAKSQGLWFWTERTEKTAFESVWRNPGGGFLRCTTFMPRISACHVGNDPDLCFQILGEEASAFDYCIQDDSNGNILSLNSVTGDYLFANCKGVTLIGTGIVTRKGSTVTLQHYPSDRRVLVRIDGSSNKAIGAIQSLPLGVTFNLMDRNISNNSCSCN